MSNHFRVIFLFLTIVAVLFVSAFGTTNVYADDGTLPPADTAETAPPPEDGEPVVTEPSDEAIPPAEEAPVTEPSDAAPPPVEEEPVAAEPSDPVPAETESAPSPEAPVTEEQTPAEPAAVVETILEQVPDNTTVTVLDAEGEVQSLSTPESVEAILLSDPIWCPAGQAPTPGSNGCTQSYTSFTDLLTFLQANESNTAYQQAGTIYVQKDQYLGGESVIDFNQYNFQNLNNYDLTIQGGWDTVDNSVDPTDTSNFNVPIIIGSSTNPWAGSLILNNLVISGVSSQTGLTLFSESDITLSNVEVTNSQAGTSLTAGGDVELVNSSFNNNQKFGAVIKAGEDVTITDSEFNNNKSTKYDSHGLKINSQGNVSLVGVTASNNEKFGADVTTLGQVTVQNSVFSGNVSYYYNCGKKISNGGYGLKVVTSADISLDGVAAEGNYFFGAHLEGANVEVANSFFNNNGSGSLDKATGYGLEVLSTAGVTLRSVEANNNQLFGANIQAEYDVYVNNSFFNGNHSYTYTCGQSRRNSANCHTCTQTYNGYGLQVVTNGNITMNDVTANENYLFGAHLEGLHVAISSGTFSGNGSGSSSTLTGRGLEIESAGAVSLSNIEANHNQLFGANVQAVDNVAINDSFFNGQQVYKYSCGGQSTLVGGGYGLKVVTQGSINMSNIEASDNYLYGAQLEGAAVAISNGTFNNNKEGLNIDSSSSVSLSSVVASYNRLAGATIEAEDMVSISDSVFNGNHSYTYNCKGKTFYGYGLKVVTNGFVSLSNVTAEENYLYGAHLEGSDMSIAFSSFSNNGTGVLTDHVGKGLEIESTGTVSLYEVTASNNQLFGANIEADGSVFINNSVFNGNLSYTSTCQGKTYDGYGLQVVTTSDVYLNYVSASNNHLFGAHIEGNYVEVSDSTFNFNSSGSDKNPTGRGLEIESAGDVLVKYVEASNNQLFGADIESDGNVTVLSSVFAGNKYQSYSNCKGTKGGYGIKVVAKGDIVLASDPNAPGFGVIAANNGAEGAILNGSNTVQVSDSSFTNNGANGITITANGNVTLNNVTAAGNGLNGVEVTGVCTNVLYVNGGTFAGNGKYGLKVTKATYTPDGTQTFASNSSGNVFQSSSTCFTSGSNNSGSNGWSWPWWGYHYR